MDIHIISKRIIQLCGERRWSFYKLAKEAGFDQSTLTPILHEKNMPNLYTLSDICKAFDITLADFFSCQLFEGAVSTDNFIELWKQLNKTEREKVLIYMYGLLHKEINEEEFKDGI